MTPHECPREQDVLDALAARRWPARCEEELRQHVVVCRVCRDLLEVAGALLDESQTGRGQPPVPPASVVWWKAQLRAREEAARAAARPLRLALRVALCCLCAAAAIALVKAAPSLWGIVPDVHSWTFSIDRAAAREAVLSALANRSILLAATAWLVLGPVALYFALAED